MSGIFLAHPLTQPLFCPYPASASLCFHSSLLFSPLSHFACFSPFLQFQGITEMENYSGSCEEYIATQEEQGDVGKKYGGLAPKKKPLISKDHERAFFDSADWALCKQGAGVNQKTTIAVENLRPKLQRTPHQQLPPRRPTCTSGNLAD